MIKTVLLKHALAVIVCPGKFVTAVKNKEKHTRSEMSGEATAARSSRVRTYVFRYCVAATVARIPSVQAPRAIIIFLPIIIIHMSDILFCPTTG